MSFQSKIEEVTGIKKSEQDEIFQAVKANSKLLDTCSGHDFSICLDRHTKEPIENPTPQQHFGAYWRCSKCGGRVDGLARIWFNRGVSHSDRIHQLESALKKLSDLLEKTRGNIFVDRPTLTWFDDRDNALTKAKALLSPP